MHTPGPDNTPALSLAQTERVARLAMLAPSPQQLERWQGDLSRVLAYVQRVQAIDLTNVPPWSPELGVDGRASGVSRIRPDEAPSGHAATPTWSLLTSDQLMAIAPRVPPDQPASTLPPFVRVPKVVEGGEGGGGGGGGGSGGGGA